MVYIDMKKQGSHPVHVVRLDASQDGDGTPLNQEPGWFSIERICSVVCLVLPTIAAVFYFFFIAADRYETEAKFVVRTPLSSAATQITSLVQGSKFVRSADDAYIVHAYLQSPAAVRELSSELPLIDLLTKSGIDFLWSYPPLLRTPSDQRLHKHFQRFIDVSFDQTTGISTLRVQAFDPKDAAQIATTLLSNSERLINRLNRRVLEDAIQNANREVDTSQDTAIGRQKELTDFRVRASVVDPVKMSKSMEANIGELLLEAAKVRAQISELTRASPNSAQLQSLRLRASALDDQIGVEQRRLAGTDTSLAPQVAEYERLSLFREFAERSLGSALTGLELARTDGMKQKLYLEQISAPAVADHPLYPYRILSIIGVALLGYAVNSLLSSMIGKGSRAA